MHIYVCRLFWFQYVLKINHITSILDIKSYDLSSEYVPKIAEISALGALGAFRGAGPAPAAHRGLLGGGGGGIFMGFFMGIFMGFFMDISEWNVHGNFGNFHGSN